MARSVLWARPVLSQGASTWVMGVAVSLVIGTGAAQAELPYRVEWKVQLGTSRLEMATAVGTDFQGNVYVAGYTAGALAGAGSGNEDCFLYKYNNVGQLQWKTQFGTSGIDCLLCMCVAGSGNVYVSGVSGGALPGMTASGCFVRKYDTLGNVAWTRGVSTALPAHIEVDAAENFFITGSIGASNGQGDAQLGKFDSNGTLQWMQQINTLKDDRGNNVRLDGFGNVYWTGSTAGTAVQNTILYSDAFLNKYDVNGTLQWQAQLATSGAETGYTVDSDASGNAYVAGMTTGALSGPNAGGQDGYVAKFSSSGSLLWKKQFGTTGDEVAFVDVDDAGNAFITGDTTGSLNGSNAGVRDLFLRKYDTSGSLLWGTQIGTSQDDRVFSASLDSFGGVYLVGETLGNLALASPTTQSMGDYDAFLIKYVPVPEPTSAGFLGTAAMVLLATRRRHGCCSRS